MIALDMGKADADVDRQVICVTSIDENRYPKEQIVSAAAKCKWNCKPFCHRNNKVFGYDKYYCN